MSFPVVNLNTVCQIDMGSAPKGSTYVELSSGTPLIAGAADYGEIYPNPKKSTNDPTKLCKKGDIIICVRATIGDLNWADKEYCLGRGVAGLRVNSKYLDSKYLWYFIASYEKDLYRSSTGSTFPQINKKVIEYIPLPLPPLETQKQIAAVLEKADQLRKDCQQMEQALNSLAQSVFIDMFGDPITNPKKWEMRTLKEFYISDKAGTKCGPFGSALKKQEFVDSGVPVWNMSNITLQGKFTDGASLWITEDKYEDLESYGVEQGDVIISRAGTVGKMGVVSSVYDKSIISTNLIRVRFSEELHPLYFVCLMTYFKTRLKRLKVGDDGSFSHMNTGILDHLEFPYPPKGEQLKYIQFRSKLDLQVDQLNGLKSEYDEQFNALMQKAFKGELNLDKSAA